jgi:hypothetical protein
MYIPAVTGNLNNAIANAALLLAKQDVYVSEWNCKIDSGLFATSNEFLVQNFRCRLVGVEKNVVG